MEKILVSILIVEPDVLLEHVSIAAIPPVKKTDTTVLIICCSLVGIIGFGAALMFLHKRRNIIYFYIYLKNVWLSFEYIRTNSS